LDLFGEGIALRRMKRRVNSYIQFEKKMGGRRRRKLKSRAEYHTTRRETTIY
jgi:hypothetical protein